jgi:hypothetical protein
VDRGVLPACPSVVEALTGSVESPGPRPGRPSFPHW